jgi:hypothetical protein
MQNPRQRQIAINDRAEAFPRQLMPLTAMPEGPQPRAHNFPPEYLYCYEVPRNSVIVEVALHHRLKPAPCISDPFVTPPTQLLPYRPQFVAQPFLDGLPPNREPAMYPGFPADMRETQKVEGLGFALAPLLPV